MEVNKRKIICWIFSILVIFLVIYFLLINYLNNKILESEQFDVSEHLSDHIENRIGMSCDDFYELVTEFIDSDIEDIIEAGEKGEDWLAMVSDRRLEKIDLYEKNAFDCMLVELNKNNNDDRFKPIQEMLAPLEAFSHGAPEKNRTSRSLKPEAFALIKEKYYLIKNKTQ